MPPAAPKTVTFDAYNSQLVSIRSIVSIAEAEGPGKSNGRVVAAYLAGRRREGAALGLCEYRPCGEHCDRIGWGEMDDWRGGVDC